MSGLAYRASKGATEGEAPTKQKGSPLVHAYRAGKGATACERYPSVRGPPALAALHEGSGNFQPPDKSGRRSGRCQRRSCRRRNRGFALGRTIC